MWRFAGTEVRMPAGTIKIAPGWHSFEIRASDNSGGCYGPDAPSPQINGGYGLAVMRPGDTAKHPFDERTLTLTRKALVAQSAYRGGIEGELKVAEGATLSNGSPWSGANLNDRYCPIYGTLKGTGTLSGPFRFSGDDNCWEVTNAVATSTSLPCVAFTSPDAETLAGLKSLKVTFNGKPTRSLYEISDALGLTAEAAAEVALTVVDEATNDYSANFALVVDGAKLKLRNNKPGGMVIILR